MKKFIGIVAMLLAAPAFGQENTSEIHYKLYLGKTDAGAYANAYETRPGSTFSSFRDVVTVSENDLADVDPAVNPVLTWAASVACAGNYSTTGTGKAIWGAANLVWDLKLYKADGGVVEQSPVGDPGDAEHTASSVTTQFGLGSSPLQHAGNPDVAGFFSMINDGDTDGGKGINDVLQAAAFTYSWMVYMPYTYDPGMLISTAAQDGPGLSRFQYPSTLAYPTGSQAKSGTLMGMGAGYTEYKNDTDQCEGFEEDCLPGGTAVLGLQRSGVGLTETCFSDPTWGTQVPMYIAEGQLNLKGLPPGQYQLVLTPGKGNNILRGDVTTDCRSHINGNFAAAASSAANMVTGDTINFTITGIPPVATVVSAVSRRLHGAVVGDINLPIAAGSVPGVECRRDGPQTIVVTCDQNVSVAPTVTLTDALGAAVGTLGTVVADGSNAVTINMSGVPDLVCLNVTLGGSVTGTVKVAVVAGDAAGTGNRSVTGGDTNYVKGQVNQAVTTSNFRADVVVNGSITGADTNFVKSKVNNALTQTCSN